MKIFARAASGEGTTRPLPGTSAHKSAHGVATYEAYRAGATLAEVRERVAPGLLERSGSRFQEGRLARSVRADIAKAYRS